MRGISGCTRWLVMVLGGMTVQFCFGGSPVYVGTSKHSNRSMDSVEHVEWQRLLSKYVDQSGRVDYAGWKKSAEDQKRLDRYLRSLSAANRAVAAKRNSQLAFWINAYNAVTIRGILREYPTTSIRNHTPRLFGYHIWKDLKLYVGGKPYSLDQIEHEILRKMSEPRIHFAIVCASVSCPRLLNEAYTGEKLDTQLSVNAKDFFSREQNFRYDGSADRFYLSAILDWFGDDFGDNQADVLKGISDWLPSQAAIRAARKNSPSVEYIDYNWDLNRQ
ncbi:MAG: DUF547 domain-containing protein [Rubripirellula sp.]|nr:DUF547 domain-containing protein [Rubripirellula sp.]